VFQTSRLSRKMSLKIKQKIRLKKTIFYWGRRRINKRKRKKDVAESFLCPLKSAL
jgi:hypothetical protein